MTHATLTKKRRSPAEKYGRYRWIEMLQRRILNRIDRMEKRQRLILKGLQHYFVFPKDYVLNVIAETRLDHAIVQVLRETGPMGALPSKIAYQLRTYGVDRFKVSRHIKAMNRRLQRELGYDVAEKIGHNWALTDFVVDIWGGRQRRNDGKVALAYLLGLRLWALSRNKTIEAWSWLIEETTSQKFLDDFLSL